VNLAPPAGFEPTAPGLGKLYARSPEVTCGHPAPEIKANPDSPLRQDHLRLAQRGHLVDTSPSEKKARN
jgi:hypothetical protein